VRLWILFLCALTGVNKFSGAVAEETVAELTSFQLILVS